MIVTISGMPGSGKSTVARAVAERLNLKHYSAGDFMREMARERGVSLVELGKMAEKDPSIDKEIDERNKQLAQEDNFVIDSRLAFHFIPNALRIFLKVDPAAAAKRIWTDIREGRRKDEDVFSSEEDVLGSIERRLESEKKRYQDYYGINYLDEGNYDFVLDTTNLSIGESVNRVVEFIEGKDLKTG